MTHPHHQAHNSSKEERLHRVLGSGKAKHEIRSAVVKGVREHENAQHGGKHEKLRFADGGVVPGSKSKARGDRSGRKGAKVNVNVIVASGKGQQPQPPMAPPMQPPQAMPPRPPMAGPMMGAPPPGVNLPPGAMPPPGMMLPGRERGGRVGKGHYDAGAISAEGRLEKIANYGAKARQGEKK